MIILFLVTNDISGQSTNTSRVGNITKTSVKPPTSIPPPPITKPTTDQTKNKPPVPSNRPPPIRIPANHRPATRRPTLDDSTEEDNPFAKPRDTSSRAVTPPQDSLILSPDPPRVLSPDKRDSLSPLPPSPLQSSNNNYSSPLPPSPFSPSEMDDSVIDDALLASLRGTPDGPESPPNKRVGCLIVGFLCVQSIFIASF